jgi:hypothetical protein
MAHPLHGDLGSVLGLKVKDVHNVVSGRSGGGTGFTTDSVAKVERRSDGAEFLLRRLDFARQD